MHPLAGPAHRSDAAGPGGGASGNRVIGNESNDNGLSVVTIHSHAPNQYVNDNVTIGNRLSHDALTGNNGAPDDVDFGDAPNTGIFAQNVTTATPVLRTNSLFNVGVPVHQQ